MSEVSVSVNFLVKGSDGNEISKNIVSDLIEQHDNTTNISIESAMSFGLMETILITIVGAVSSHFVIKLIEKCITNNKKNIVKIEIFHSETNQIFVIPENKKQCVEHFLSWEKQCRK